MMPPWPGMMSPKSLILNALLNPDAKKPPNGPMMEAKRERKKVWTKKGKKVTVSFMFNSLLQVANVCTGLKVVSSSVYSGLHYTHTREPFQISNKVANI